MRPLVFFKNCISKGDAFLPCPECLLSSSSGRRRDLVVQNRTTWNAFQNMHLPRTGARAYSQVRLNGYLQKTLHQRSQTPIRADAASVSSRLTTPSEVLISALEARGHMFAVPVKHEHKADLSHLSPLSGKKASQRPRPRLGGSLPIRHVRVSKKLQSVLAQYLRFIHYPSDNKIFSESIPAATSGALDRRILHVFNEDTMALLRSKGYDADDVASWAAILTNKSSVKAALLLMALSNQNIRHIPVFVFLFLLRRPQISPRALKLLILHAWERLENRRNIHWGSIFQNGTDAQSKNLLLPTRTSETAGTMPVCYQTMSEPTIIVMIIRLFRHARKTWPESMQNISTMFATHVHGRYPAKDPLGFEEMSEKKSLRLSALYNRALHLLSLPSSEHPYRSIPYHQRAQFHIVRRMNAFKPALAINRIGYRAVTRVQLAHRKTPQERQWAAMKAVSWPPWKEEKLGIDADVGPEFGVSRANEALSRLKEAGYAPREWEMSAKVLSGWDTDNSPTIQTRVVSHPHSHQRLVQFSGGISEDTLESQYVWAARIRSTRTLDEAWACFLAYKDRRESPSHAAYQMMFEKIAFDNKRRREDSRRSRMESRQIPSARLTPEHAGDGREVIAPPTDPRDRIYVRTSPPNIDTLFNDMIANGVRPSGRCLSILLEHASSISDGLRYLRSSNLKPELVEGLSKWQCPLSEELRIFLNELPENIFLSYIKLLCRSKYSEFHKSTRIPIYPPLYASELVHAYVPLNKPPWYALLAALIRPGAAFKRREIVNSPFFREIAAWESMLSIVYHMEELDIELDFTGFNMLCFGLEKALSASRHIRDDFRRPIAVNESSSQVVQQSRDSELADWDCVQLGGQEVFPNGLRKLKALFVRLVAWHFEDPLSKAATAPFRTSWSLKITTGSQMLLPRTLAVPAPPELHIFIRVLGLNADYDGILLLVQWMVQYAAELKAVAAEIKNGSAMMRRCLVAVRAFTEAQWRTSHLTTCAETPMADQALASINEKIFTGIGSVDDWGGWPTDEEVESYCRFSQNRLDRIAKY